MTTKIKILLALDPRLQFDIPESLFDSEKYEVITVFDGSEAFNILNNNHNYIDLVLVDYHLPVINGIELIETLKGSGKIYGFIFISTDKTIDTIIQAMKAGADDFIPVDSNLKSSLPPVIDKVYGLHLIRKSRKEIDNQIRILSTAVEQSGSIVVITDRNGQIEYVNQKFTDLTGYSFEEVKGQTPGILKSGATSEEEYNLLWKTITSGKSWKGEFMNKKKNGEVYYEETSISPVKNEDGEIIRFVAVKVDTTERRKMEIALKNKEAHLRLITDNIPMLICHTDRNLNCLFVNKQYTDLYNFPADTIIGKKVNEILGNEAFLHCYPYIKKVLGGETVSFEKRNLFKSTEEKTYNVTMVPQITDNEVIGYFAILMDITDLKQKEQKLIELNAMKDKFFSVIAHDLRSPFNYLIGISELLTQNIRKYNIEKTETFLAQISTSAKNTYELLENLLEWAKSQSDKRIINKRNFNVKDTLEELFNQLKNLMAAKDLEFHYHIDNELIINTDKNMLIVVVRNLLTNAIKYSNKNGKIIVEVTKLGDKIDFEISDNGVGIDEKNMVRLFKIGENPSTQGTNNEKGSGLGLLLCKEFIEKLGGRIRVKSEPGQGSKFSFSLQVE